MIRAILLMASQPPLASFPLATLNRVCRSVYRQAVICVKLKCFLQEFNSCSIPQLADDVLVCEGSCESLCFA